MSEAPALSGYTLYIRKEIQVTIKSQQVGKVATDQQGYDFYYLVEDTENPLTPQEAKDWLMPTVYREAPHEGGLFCNTILASQVEHSVSKVICIVKVQRD